jgi:hypothetical protein
MDMKIARALLGVTVVATAIACGGSATATRQDAVTAESVALQQGDVSGMQRCAGSGDIDTVLLSQKSKDPFAYAENAAVWNRWKRAGAKEAYLAVYGRTGRDCAAMTSAGPGAPTGGLVVGLVVKYKDAAVAESGFKATSTLLGFGPKDLLFIRLAGGSVVTGSVTGLGPQSRVGSGTVAGSTYYFAFWQNKDFDADFMGYNVAATDANTAVMDMNGRIR